MRMVAMFFLLILPICLVIAVAYTCRAIRRRRVSTVLAYLEQAVRLNLPLPSMLNAAAAGETGATRGSLVAMSRLLQQGQTVADAFRAAVHEATGLEGNAIEAGEQSGRLAGALDRLLRRAKPVNSGSSDRNSFYRLYLIFAVPVMVIVFSLYTIFVLPKFKGIFHDFHISLPLPSTLVMSLAADSYLQWAAVAVALVPIVWVLLRFNEMFQESPRPRWIANTLGFIAWYTPILHGMIRDRGITDLCEQVADSADAGLPLVQAVQQSIPLQDNFVMRSKVRRWCTALRDGKSTAEAARGAGLPRLLCGLLATVRGDDDLIAVMSFVARHHFNRFSRTSAFMQAAFVPMVVLLLGSLVALIGLSIFLPLARLAAAAGPYSRGPL